MVVILTVVTLSLFCSFTGGGDPDLEFHIHPSFPSFLTRAYHTRPTQHSTDGDQSSGSTAHNLPQYHPLLVRHADHPQQQSARATTGGPRVNFDSGNSAEIQHETASAMQQLLSNISAAAGTNEVLSFGVGTSGTQRNRSGACWLFRPRILLPLTLLSIL